MVVVRVRKPRIRRGACGGPPGAPEARPPGSTLDAMLQAIDLCVAHVPGRLVLDGVSHAFAPGALTAVLGPNGAGKSTLLRTLLGALKPVRGEVVLGGRPVRDLRPAERASRLAFIPQRSDAIFAFSLAEMVAMADARRGPREVDAAIDRVGLAPFARAAFSSLSAGQQQRGLLARALVQLGEGDGAGAVLLADEPVASMDPRHAIATMGLLRDLAARGVTVVAVLHDLALASSFATHALLVDGGGRVAGAGPATDLFDPERFGRLYDAPFRRLETPGGNGMLLVDVARGRDAQGEGRGAMS